MILRLSILGLLIVLVAVLVWRSMEGFVNPTGLSRLAPAASSAPSAPAALSSAPAPTTVSVTETTFDAMDAKQKADLLREIKRTLREEILADRAFDSLGRGKRKDTDDADDDADDDDTDNADDADSRDGSMNGCSDATLQGSEYMRRKKSQDDCTADSCNDDVEARCPTNPNGSCPSMPDMSKYIRKDAIPCWGCSIDF